MAVQNRIVWRVEESLKEFTADEMLEGDNLYEAWASVALNLQARPTSGNITISRHVCTRPCELSGADQAEGYGKQRAKKDLCWVT